ncbi:MAG: penicillin acylase family protein [Bacteroidota bacterium]|nr:penicillin acylase family protein [Bacteroidota bacterium]
MTKPLKISIGIIASLFIILIALFFFFRYLIIKSFPEYEGTISVKGLHKTVKIYRDEFGVPHIFAESEHDLMFAAGYVHAQDRLWQMDITRRTGEGRLSEVLGYATADFDKLFRVLNINDVVNRIYEQIPSEVKSALQAYADGINAYINDHKGKYPVEFDMTGYEPELWTVKNSLLLSRLMAWDLNMAWWVDLTMGKLMEKVDLQKAAEIFPNYPNSTPVIIETQSAASVTGFMKVVQSYRNYFGTDGSAIGSNSWVIDSTLSASGKPILANDPHLGLPAPSKWYEMHLSAPGWDVAGVSLPGTPFIIIGSNREIAWGLTNGMIDEADFYIEKIDSVKPTNYIYENKSLPIETREETIYIGKDDSVVINVRRTHHGPIISDIHPVTKYSVTDEKQKPVSMKWVGFEVSSEPVAFYIINKSQNAQDFERGVREFAVPGQNIVYADVDGNIGYWTAARIPVRGKHNPTLPLPGWSSEYEWKGFVPFEKLPKLWNPKEGFIATANNKIIDNSPYFISNLYMPPSRIQRIIELLTKSKKFSAEDFKIFQSDYTSPHAKKITDVLIGSFKNFTDTTSVFQYLQNWDYKHSPTDIASTIFNMFFVKLLHNIFEDEMGSDLFEDYIFFSALPINAVDGLLKSTNSSWFDNIHTEEIETKDYIIRKSFTDAIEELKKELGPEMKNWQWGKVHTVTFEHPFGARQPLDKVFNIGPFPVGGSMATINNGEYKFNKPFRNHVGPSTRIIIDLSRLSEYFSVIPTGQSGQLLHKHYNDQTKLWLNGVYKTVNTDKDVIEKSNWKKLELEPKLDIRQDLSGE